MTEAQAAHVEAVSDTAAPDETPSAEDLSLVQSLADENMGWEEMWDLQDAEEKADQDGANDEKGQGGDDLSAGEGAISDGLQGADDAAGASEGDGQGTDGPKAAAPGDQNIQSKDSATQEIDWTQVPPEYRAEYDRLIADNKANAGRVAAYQRRYETEKAKLDRLGAAAQTTTQSQASGPDIKATVTAVNKLAEELPEVGGPIRDAIAILAGEVNRLQSSENIRKASEASQFDKKVYSEIDKMEETHPGFQQFIREREADFLEWVNDQPRATRELVARNAANFQDADGFIPIFEAYKNHLGMSPTNQNGTPAAASLNGTSASGQTTPQDSTQPVNRIRERQKDASTAVPRASSPGSMNTLPSGTGSWDDTWDEWDRHDAIHGTD